MIKILRVKEVPLLDESGNLIRTILTVEIDINGIPWSVGGLDAGQFQTRSQLRKHLVAREAEILADAQRENLEAVIDRPDLADKSILHNPFNEINNLRARIESLEARSI